MKKIGIIGAGNFGTALAQVLRANGNEILFYVRTERGLKDSTTSLELLFQSCKIIFIAIPVENIPKLLDNVKNFIKLDHVLVHCIKGLIFLEGSQIFTVSEYIKHFLQHENVACLSGPNLGNEMKDLMLTGAVIASEKHEIAEQIKSLMQNDKFVVFESRDLVGIELMGVLKNIFALASGILNGLGEGDNAKALLVTLGLPEMVKIAKNFSKNFEEKTLWSVAGVGDLIATCSSNLSRNFTVGKRLAQGEKLQEILADGLTAEGIKTTYIIFHFIKKENINVPIVKAVYKILFEEHSPQSLFECLTNV